MINNNKHENIKKNAKNIKQESGGANSGQGGVDNKSKRSQSVKAQNISFVPVLGSFSFARLWFKPVTCYCLQKNKNL